MTTLKTAVNERGFLSLFSEFATTTTKHTQKTTRNIFIIQYVKCREKFFFNVYKCKTWFESCLLSFHELFYLRIANSYEYVARTICTKLIFKKFIIKRFRKSVSKNF